MGNTANNKSNEVVMGIYNFGSSSPEGGSHLIVLENGDYAITYFGGIQVGKWKACGEKRYQFTPNLSESSFELFGRHNKDLNDRTKISFNGFENSETFIQVRASEAKEFTLQRIFNVGANCFSYPYVYEFKTIGDEISFMFLQYDSREKSIYTINNPEKYNDFVANFNEVDTHSAQSFWATFENDTLYFDENDASQRMPLEEDDEDIEYIKNLVKSSSDQETIYINPWYNIFGQPDSPGEELSMDEDYVFDKEKNAFIDTEYYEEGMENRDSEEYFDDMSIVYEYKALKEVKKESVDFSIDDNSLFHASCE